MAATQAYLPFDYVLWLALVIVTGYYFIRVYRIAKEMPTELGGAAGKATRYIVVGTGFIFIHALYEFTVIHYDQAWYVAKFLSVTPQVFGFALISYGMFQYFRTIDVL